MILAHCRHCGATFQSRAFKVSNVFNLTLSGNREECPNCHKMADIADGTFNVVGGMIQVVSAPDITRSMYASFLGIAQKAKDKEIEPSVFVEMAEAIDPRFGKAAQIALKHRGWGFMLLLVLWLNSCVSLDVKLDVNQLYDQAFGRPGIEYVLPDEQPADDRNGELGADHANPSEKSPEGQNREFDALTTRRKQLLMVSASMIAISTIFR